MRRRRSASSDANLIDRARRGDLEAYGQLFERHEASARSLAQQLTGSAGEADDAVSEAFERVLGAIRRGTGPQDSFRPYLLTAVRRTVYDRSRRERRTGPTADEWVLDQGVEDPDLFIDSFERDALARAFRTLPERWQTVLWHTEVEETAQEDLAAILGMRSNAVAALAYRAREGLRQAYVQAHVDIDLTEPSDDCRWALERLSKYVRGRLSDNAEVKIERHLDQCPDCHGMYLEMVDVGVSLRSVMAPLVVGGPAGVAAVKSMTAGTSAAAGASTLAGLTAGGAASGTIAASGAVAAGSGAVVSGIAAVAVVASIGGVLVFPPDDIAFFDPPPAAAVEHGRTLPGIEEPVEVTNAPSTSTPAVARSTAGADEPASSSPETDDGQIGGDPALEPIGDIGGSDLIVLTESDLDEQGGSSATQGGEGPRQVGALVITRDSVDD